MFDQILTLLVCGVPPLLLVLGSAIIGSLYRKKLANRIIAGMRKGRFSDFSTQQGARRLRVLSLLGLMSMVGIFVIFTLVWAKILPYGSTWTLALFILFVLVGIVSGMLLLKQVLDRIRE